MSRSLALVAVLLCFGSAAGAATLNNDDSCDIAVMPAATLLLPYFEVDLDSPGRTTIFTITNVTNVDRIARVTLWTDRAYPVFNFNIYLTGYDVQAINLYDVIANGVVGSANGVGFGVNPRRRFSKQNFAIDLSGCAVLAGKLDPGSITYMKAALTEGKVGNCNVAGGTHALATGYLTIDVVRNCATSLPTERAYWTDEIAYDNVLIGEFHHVDSAYDFAQGEAMVHIRAIPEGGGATPLPRTFYSRYVPADLPKGLDGRQPLPSIFAARWINGGPGQFQTSMKIWREGRTGATANCADYAAEALLAIGDAIRFDEAENAVGEVPSPPGSPRGYSTSASTLASVANANAFPQLANGATSGWFYFNLDHCLSGQNCTQGRDATQNWVVVSMRAEGRYSADTPATMMGNGCSRPTPRSEVLAGPQVIAPAPNVRP